jgi:hypothetical protein
VRNQVFEALIFLGRAESHDAFDEEAIIPTAVEEHDLPCGGEALDVALVINLGFFAFVRRGQGDHLKNPRAGPFGDAFDDSAFASRVAPFKNHDRARAGFFDPELQLDQLRLQTGQLFVVIGGGGSLFWRPSFSCLGPILFT